MSRIMGGVIVTDEQHAAWVASSKPQEAAEVAEDTGFLAELLGVEEPTAADVAADEETADAIADAISDDEDEEPVKKPVKRGKAKA